MSKVCKRCNYVAANRSNLVTHLTRINPCIPYDGCPTNDQDIDILLEEIGVVPNEIRSQVYKCERCDATYKHKSTLCKHVKTTHHPHRIEQSKERVELDGLRADVDSLKIANALLLRHLPAGDQVTKPKVINKKNESFYQAIVEQHLGGGHKKLLIGETDVTTETHHAEIKNWDCWKESVGQLTVYNNEDPKEHLHVYLFGKCSIEKRIRVVDALQKCKMNVFTFDEEDRIVSLM